MESYQQVPKTPVLLIPPTATNDTKEAPVPKRQTAGLHHNASVFALIQPIDAVFSTRHTSVVSASSPSKVCPVQQEG